MKRDDYLKFLEIAEKELEYPYFVQYYKTEKKYDRGHAQIRNSETTAIIKDDKNKQFNKGIFIDIFPLDNVPDNKILKNWFIFKIRIQKIILNTYYICEYKNKFVLGLLKGFAKIYWKIFDFQKSIEKYEKSIQKYNNRKTKQCGALGFRPTEFKYDNSWFDELIEVDFEYLKLNVSSKYDEHLTIQYGDYMKIPENKNGTFHGSVFFDTEKSYKEYENKIDEIFK
jgi:lipopolysaccharide cholinephosphotransferase